MPAQRPMNPDEKARWRALSVSPRSTTYWTEATPTSVGCISPPAVLVGRADRLGAKAQPSSLTHDSSDALRHEPLPCPSTLALQST